MFIAGNKKEGDNPPCYGFQYAAHEDYLEQLLKGMDKAIVNENVSIPVRGELVHLAVWIRKWLVMSNGCTLKHLEDTYRQYGINCYLSDSFIFEG